MIVKILLPVFFVLILFEISIAQTVYITKTGKKYHNSGCGSLSYTSFSVSLQEAIDQGYTPCKRCNPPTTVSGKTTNDMKNFAPNITTKKKESGTNGTRCLAKTKKGTQCKRNAEPGSNYCWQHK